MYIPKTTRIEMFLKRKVSTSSRKNNNKDVSDTNWSETCAVFLKDVVLRRRSSLKKNKKSIAPQEEDLLHPNNLCFDHLSEFQKSYVSFPEFNDSTISNESECSSNTQPSLTPSFSFSSYTSSHF